MSTDTHTLVSKMSEVIYPHSNDRINHLYTNLKILWLRIKKFHQNDTT